MDFTKDRSINGLQNKIGKVSLCRHDDSKVSCIFPLKKEVRKLAAHILYIQFLDKSWRFNKASHHASIG